MYLFELIFIGFLIKDGYRISEMVWGQISPALGLRYAYVYMSVPVGACVMGIHVLGSMLKRYSPSRGACAGGI